MSKLVPIESSPLMQPVHYKGQTYFTGQYFHQMYRTNSNADGRYKQFQHFARLIRSIETYPQYLAAGDIVELEKADAEHALASGEAGPELGLAFKATFGKPIMLINATAPVRAATVRALGRIAPNNATTSQEIRHETHR
jgi:hypothetical protein